MQETHTLKVFPLGAYTKSDLFQFYEKTEHRGLSRDMFNRWVKQVFGKNHKTQKLSAAEVKLFFAKKGLPRGYYLPRILELETIQ